MTKFLNISTDNTLGGSSPSDVAVSSQKAVKEYVDSQTGTAPAFANITGQPTDNTNLASALNAKYDASNPNGYTSNVGTVTSVNNVSPVNGNVTLSIPAVDSALSTTSTNAVQNKVITSALNGKLDGFTLRFAGNWTGGVHAVNFVTIDYSGCNSENGVFIKFSMVNSHGNGQAGRFLQDVVLNVTYSGGVVGTLYRYFAVPIDQASSEYYGSHSYGDVFWVNDTTNKIVKFYVLMHQYSYTSQSPYFRLNASTKGVITQATGGAGASEYSSGTRVWTTINWFETDQTYSATSAKPQSGVAVASAVSGYVPTSRTVNGKALSSNISLSASDVGALPDSTVIPTVNNATLTIQKNGTTVKTFTANASTDVTANIIVPTKVSDLTNDSGFISGITSSDVTTALGYTPYNSSNPSGYQANVIETVKVNNTALTPSSKAVNITVPTKVSDLTNDSGFISGITSSDVTTALGYTPYNSSNPSGYQANVIETVKVNGTALTPSSKAVDVTVPTETTVSGWGFTKNAGTVTSVNNVSPVNGNVTLSIPTVNNATLTLTQGGTTKGTFTANASSNVTIDLDSGGSVDVDNKSITTNSSDEIQTVGVINSRDSSTAIKTWTGTKAQYDAITTKDSATLYNITDDTTITQTILEALYPVGSIYITTANTCPLSALISGSTWTLVSSGIVKAGDIPCKGNGITLGLTQGTNNYGIYAGTSSDYNILTSYSAYGASVGSTGSGSNFVSNTTFGLTTDPTKSGIIADTSSLTLSVNIFERTA